MKNNHLKRINILQIVGPLWIRKSRFHDGTVIFRMKRSGVLQNKAALSIIVPSAIVVSQDDTIHHLHHQCCYETMLRWILSDNPWPRLISVSIMKCYSQRDQCKGLVLVAVNVVDTFHAWRDTTDKSYSLERGNDCQCQTGPSKVKSW